MSPIDQLDVESLDSQELQRLLAAAVKAYARRREDEPELAPFPAPSPELEVVASEGLIAASAILDCLGIEVFEVALWRSWGRG